MNELRLIRSLFLSRYWRTFDAEQLLMEMEMQLALSACMCVSVWLPHATNGTRIVCYSLFCGYSGCIAHTWEIKRHDVNQWLPACLPQVACAAATAAAAGDAATAAVVGCNDATRWRCQTTFSKRKSKWASEKSGLLYNAGPVNFTWFRSFCLRFAVKFSISELWHSRRYCHRYMCSQILCVCDVSSIYICRAILLFSILLTSSRQS